MVPCFSLIFGVWPFSIFQIEYCRIVVVDLSGMFVIDLQKEQRKQELWASRLTQKRDVLAEQKKKLLLERKFYSHVKTELVELPSDLHVYRGYDGREGERKIVLTIEEKVHSRRLGGTYLFSYLFHKYGEIIRRKFIKWRTNIAIDANVLSKMFHMWRGYVSKITLRRLNGLIFIRKTYKLSIVWKHIKKLSAFKRLVLCSAWNKQHRRIKLLFNCWKSFSNLSRTSNHDKLEKMDKIHGRHLASMYFKKIMLLSRRFRALNRIHCRKALNSWVTMAKLDALLDSSNVSAFPLDDYMNNSIVTVTVTTGNSAPTTPVKSVSSVKSAKKTVPKHHVDCHCVTCCRNKSLLATPTPSARSTPATNKKSVTPLSRNTSIRDDRAVSFFEDPVDASKISNNATLTQPKSKLRMPKATATAQEKFLYRLAVAKEAAKETEGH